MMLLVPTFLELAAYIFVGVYLFNLVFGNIFVLYVRIKYKYWNGYYDDLTLLVIPIFNTTYIFAYDEFYDFIKEEYKYKKKREHELLMYDLYERMMDEGMDDIYEQASLDSR